MRERSCEVCGDPAVGSVQFRIGFRRFSRSRWKLLLCSRCGQSVSHVLQGVRAELGATRGDRKRAAQRLARDLARQVSV